MRAAPTWIALALAGLSLSSAGQEAAQEPELGTPVRSFSIPDTRQGRALHERALAHVAAERWAEAIADLQALIVEHRGDLLGPSREASDGTPSQQPIHLGVAEAARSALLALPNEARALYAERYSAEAAAALDAARRSADRRALIEVARRWPLTEAAALAWWTAGDLELELGNPRAAADAWCRARDRQELAGSAPSAGAGMRLRFLEGDDGALGGALGGTLSEIEDAGAAWRAAAGASPPGPDGHSWRRPVDVGSSRVPFGSDSPETYNLFPVLAGDTLLVTNSLRVFAFDAWTGRERWRSAEPPGWELVDADQMRALRDGERLDRAELFDAIDRRSVMIAPAAAGGIAVAPLQIPMTQLGNTRYQNIPITRAIPDRRLFAFDLETGRELWSHMPPPGWDGESGSFAERMRVAAPPVIAGTRVIVPAYRMQGRIDYHLACYDLYSGQLLWSTALISGQLPLNMFGRHSNEFAAAPVHVEDDRVYAVTQLGAVAACDLYTGEVVWETLYDQIPLPSTMHWTPRERRLYWHNAEPVVAGGVLVATPLDSRDIVGIDVERGAMLWSLPYDRLQRPGDYSRLALLGADREKVYLAGRTLLACRAPAGLASRSGPSEVGYGPDLLVDHQDYLPRPALGVRHVVAPTPARRVAIDRFQIRYEDRQASADWGPEETAGNALLGDGALFLLSNRFLTAIFDWDVLEERAAARYAADPEDDAAVLAFAELLAGRGRSEILEPRLASAVERLARAKDVVRERLSGEDRGYHRELEGLLYRVLCDEADALARSMRPWPQVLECLRQAEAAAPNAEALRDTLVAMAELLDGWGGVGAVGGVGGVVGEAGGPREQWLAVLARLDALPPGLALPAAEGRAPLPLDLWVVTQRARDHARRGAVESELEVLHAILAKHGDAELEGFEAPDVQGAPDAPGGALVVSERIADLLAEHGRGPYLPFEERARGAFEAARAAGDPAALEAVIDHFPHSQAAALALDARIAAALAAGETKAVVALVQRAIPRGWSPASESARELDLLLVMGRALERAGNAELFEGLLASLAAEHPDFVPTDERGTGRTLAGLALALTPSASESAGPAEPAASFDQSIRLRPPVTGSYDLIAKAAPTAERAGLLLCVRNSPSPSFDEVSAFADADPGQLWFRRIEDGVLGDREHAAHLARSTLALASSKALFGLDLLDGSVRWKWGAEELGVVGLSGADGVVIGAFGDGGDGSAFEAFDAVNGYRLWSRRTGAEHWPIPVCGAGRAVLLSRSYTGGRALVLDLFTGAEVASFALPYVDEGDLRGAWIEGGALILPQFPKTTAAQDLISAWDLRDGRRAWAVTNADELDFDSLARAAGEVYLIFSAGRQKAGAIQQLDLRLGAVRTLNVRVGPGDVPIGMDRHRVTELEGGWLYLQSRSEQSTSETIVRAIELPFGEKWRHRLPVAPSEIYDGLPRPVSSASTTVLAWTEPTRDLVRPMTQLLFLDRELGTLADSRSLDQDFGPAGRLTLATLGSSLVILGSNQMAFFAR